MFATIEEAEKAQQMLRRFGGRDSWQVMAPQGMVIGYGHGQTVESWEELADLLWSVGRDDDRRASMLTMARKHLAEAERRMGGGNISVDGYLVATLACILEALL